MGVRAVPHLPCRFDCSPTIEFGRQLLDVGHQAGFVDEVNWIKDILSWPIEWSALHGIAEVKTPVMKVSTRTDATGHKYTVQWRGTTYPEEGASGLKFPYQIPLRMIVTNSTSFQRGLSHPVQLREHQPDWYHRDNGFSSRYRMDMLHQPLVSLAQKELKGTRGHVLDLGCGNGVLLGKICSGHAGLVGHGVDINSSSIEHARLLFPEFAHNFIHGDLFDPTLWSGSQNYVLGVLMIGRLLEVSREQAARLITTLKARCDRVLVYVYPNSNDTHLETLVERAGLRLGTAIAESAGMLILD
jgi:2-polyprenyl-3-methyl-5-hydroxy-6-metoxy-1,4-benzoquinol methylase